MTTSHAAHPARGRSHATRLAGLAAALLTGSFILAGGATTLALWVDGYSFPGPAVDTGELSVSLGTATWQQVTPGVTSGASGTLTGGTASLISMPGDVVQVRVPITTTVQGDNLDAVLEVAAGEGARDDIDAGTISAGYHVENEAGTQVAPTSGDAALGSRVQIPGLGGSSTEVTANWTVVVTIDVLGDYRWSSTNPLLDLDSWSLDKVLVSLRQVREEEGTP